MALPNIGSKFARKRIRRNAAGTRGRRIKSRKNLSKSGAFLTSAKKISRNIIIAGTDPIR